MPARLHHLEQLLREAHIASLELGLELRRAQDERGLTALTGHAVFAQFDEAQARISGAMSAAAAGHRLVRSLATTVGIEPASYGETTDPEFAPPMTGAALVRVA